MVKGFDEEREVGFYITWGRKELVYTIESLNNEYLASIYRIYSYKKTTGNQILFRINYCLIYNDLRVKTPDQRRIIKIFFDNLVGVLTHDMQTIYEDDINERLNLPFYQNILQVKVAK